LIILVLHVSVSHIVNLLFGKLQVSGVTKWTGTSYCIPSPVPGLPRMVWSLYRWVLPGKKWFQNSQPHV